MPIRFSADRHLGRLAKWLRILGYDTLYEPGLADHEFLGRAIREGRSALTRKRHWGARQLPGELIVLKADRVEAQLNELLETLNLYPDPALRLTRCLRCNSPLEEADRGSVIGLIPAHVQESCDRFHRCPTCGGVYWPGTHRQHIGEVIRNRNLDRRP